MGNTALAVVSGALRSEVVKSERGVTFSELAAAIAILAIVIIAVVFVLHRVPSGVKSQTMEADIASVREAVGNFYIESGLQGRPVWPTADGKLPPEGEYALINWGASFTTSEGKVVKFYPDFLSRRPRHWEEGVWRIDSSGRVSVNLSREEY